MFVQSTTLRSSTSSLALSYSGNMSKESVTEVLRSPILTTYPVASIETCLFMLSLLIYDCLWPTCTEGHASLVTKHLGIVWFVASCHKRALSLHDCTQWPETQLDPNSRQTSVFPGEASKKKRERKKKMTTTIRALRNEACWSAII